MTWEPIESAPSALELADLFGPRAEKPDGDIMLPRLPRRWADCRRGLITRQSPGGGILTCRAWVHTDTGTEIAPTHWMPIPGPPSLKAATTETKVVGDGSSTTTARAEYRQEIADVVFDAGDQE